MKSLLERHGSLLNKPRTCPSMRHRICLNPPPRPISVQTSRSQGQQRRGQKKGDPCSVAHVRSPTAPPLLLLFADCPSPFKHTPCHTHLYPSFVWNPREESVGAGNCEHSTFEAFLSLQVTLRASARTLPRSQTCTPCLRPLQQRRSV